MDARVLAVDPRATRSLFVGDLSFFTNEKDLLELFLKFGPLMGVEIKRGRNAESLLYGFVEYESKVVAVEAMLAMNGFLFKGRRMRINWTNMRAPNVPGSETWVPIYLQFSTNDTLKIINEEFLTSILSSFGTIADVMVKRHAIDDNKIKLSGNAVAFFFDSHTVALILRMMREIVIDGIKIRCTASSSGDGPKTKFIVPRDSRQYMQEDPASQFSPQQHQPQQYYSSGIDMQSSFPGSQLNRSLQSPLYSEDSFHLSTSSKSISPPTSYKSLDHPYPLHPPAVLEKHMHMEQSRVPSKSLNVNHFYRPYHQGTDDTTGASHINTRQNHKSGLQITTMKNHLFENEEWMLPSSAAVSKTTKVITDDYVFQPPQQNTHSSLAHHKSLRTAHLQHQELPQHPMSYPAKTTNLSLQELQQKHMHSVPFVTKGQEDEDRSYPPKPLIHNPSSSLGFAKSSRNISHQDTNTSTIQHSSNNQYSNPLFQHEQFKSTISKPSLTSFIASSPPSSSHHTTTSELFAPRTELSFASNNNFNHAFAQNSAESSSFAYEHLFHR